MTFISLFTSTSKRDYKNDNYIVFLNFLMRNHISEKGTPSIKYNSVVKGQN